MTEQICVACGLAKDLETQFFKNSAKANGFDAKCKQCRGSRAKSYREENSAKIADQRKKKYADNREAVLAQKHVYYKHNVEQILAKKSEYWRKNKSVIRTRTQAWRDRNKDVVAASTKQYRDGIFEATIAVLGGKCVWCGEFEKEFLTIDHVDNDGNSERKFGSIGWKRKILDGKSDISKYRVLCHNCNLGRYRLDPVHHYADRLLAGREKKCPVCGVLKDESLFRSGHSRKCLECDRRFRVERRINMIEALGGVCVCCGLNEWHKLVLDHVHGDGASARASGQHGGIDLMAAILRGKVNKSDHQLLCWNCNHSKHRGSGLCIHQRNGTSLLGGVSTTRRNSPVDGMEQREFLLSDISVSSMELPDAKLFLNDHHYAGFGRPSSLVYGAWLKNTLVGVAKFAPPVRQGIASSLGISDHELLELDRFCIHPAYHAKNFASFFMAKVIKQIANRPEIRKLVSFADPRFGHVGTIYQASNWVKVGMTSRSYYYEDADKREINKKTLYEFAKTRNLTERKCAEALGYKKVHTPPKIKFVYDLR